jgi:hypothetical protein
VKTAEVKNEQEEEKKKKKKLKGKLLAEHPYTFGITPMPRNTKMLSVQESEELQSVDKGQSNEIEDFVPDSPSGNLNFNLFYFIQS